MIFTMRSEQSKEKSMKSMISADFDYATSWLRSRNQQARRADWFETQWDRKKTV
jgi:hypothetical protein